MSTGTGVAFCSSSRREPGSSAFVERDGRHWVPAFAGTTGYLSSRACDVRGELRLLSRTIAAAVDNKRVGTTQ